ncbi:MAG: DUF4097 family beta strand repeat-containing protein [Candidatus Limnocylindria bacterium]|nr:DUF4097 family beta strand repeat-containing protein [Candidatus Limnocylindria bacterium]
MGDDARPSDGSGDRPPLDPHRTRGRLLNEERHDDLGGATFNVDVGIGPRESGEEHEERLERTFAVRGRPSLRVSNVSGDTRIVVGEADTVVVRARKYVRGAGADRAKRLLESLEIRMEQDGDTIVVRPHLDEPERSWRDLFHGRRVAVDFEIVVPRETALDARSTSGDLYVTGVCGPLHLHNVSGDTLLSGLRGPLRLRTVSGDVRAVDCAGGCECNSVSGDLRFEGSRLQATDIQTVSGDVALDGALDPAAAHRVRTVSGDVALGVVGASFWVDFRTMSGDLDCACEARVTHEGGRDRLVLVGGGEARVQVKTVSGDLRIAGSAASVPEAAGPVPAGPPAEPAASMPYGTGASVGPAAEPGPGPGSGPSAEPPPGPGPGPRGRTLRVRVTEGGTQKVNIAIPLALARVGKVKLGGLVRGHLGKLGIDLDEAMRQAERTGRIVDLADGPDRVEIFVE